MVIVPVPATKFDPAKLTGGELVDDGQTEHQARRGPAHVGEVEVHDERRPRRIEHRDAHEAVVTILVRAQRDLRDAGRLVLAAEVDRHHLAGMVFFRNAVNCSTSATGVPLTASMASPAFSLPDRRTGFGDRRDGHGVRVLRDIPAPRTRRCPRTA